MKIIVGNVMKSFGNNVIALEIPGIGVIECSEKNEDGSLFKCVELNKEKLLILN